MNLLSMKCRLIRFSTLIMCIFVFFCGCDIWFPEESEWIKHTVSETFEGADMYVGDIDNDGNDDFISSGLFHRTLSWFNYSLENDKYIWTEHIIDSGTNTTPGDNSLSDLDDDGDLDIVVCGVCTEREEYICVASHMLWYENIDNGSSWGKHIIAEMDVLGAGYLDVEDMDGDGDPDVVATTLKMSPKQELSEIAWFRNNLDQDNGIWEKIVISAAEDGVYDANSPVIADFDNDGRSDIAVACGAYFSETGKVYWFRSKNDNQTEWERFDVDQEDDDTYCYMYKMDLNEDGMMDLVAGRNDSDFAGNQDGGGVVFFINPGNPATGGEWIKYTIEEGDFRMGSGIWLDDVDGDGKVDLLNTYPGLYRIFETGNVSLIKFHFDPVLGIVVDSREMISTNAPAALDAHTIDLNKDGIKEVIGSGLNRKGLYLYEAPVD